jgi:queuosine biosynthesis protein QueD
MKAEIYRRFTFEAAHRLPNVPAGHKCGRIHGHSYVVQVHVAGDVDAHAGWVCDFADITAAMEPLRKQLDHSFLNELHGLENPTSENLARWIWTHLGHLPGLSEVRVSETPNSCCIYRGFI